MSEKKKQFTKEELDKLKNPRTGRIAVNKLAWAQAEKDRKNKGK